MDGIAPQNQKAYSLMHEQLSLKAYSANTKRMYLAEFAHLLTRIIHGFFVMKSQNANLPAGKGR